MPSQDHTPHKPGTGIPLMAVMMLTMSMTPCRPSKQLRCRRHCCRSPRC